MFVWIHAGVCLGVCAPAGSSPGPSVLVAPGCARCAARGRRWFTCGFRRAAGYILYSALLSMTGAILSSGLRIVGTSPYYCYCQAVKQDRDAQQISSTVVIISLTVENVALVGPNQVTADRRYLTMCWKLATRK
jgi:hypothetical protein